jgi:protein TonB
MQPKEPQWDKPALSGRAIWGCLLLVAVAGASGVGFWLVRSGRLSLEQLDRLSGATPTPTMEAPTPTIGAPAIEAPTPAPESSPLVADYSQKAIEAQVQQRIREMEARLEKAAASTRALPPPAPSGTASRGKPRDGKVEGAWAPAPSSGEETPVDVRRVGGEVTPPRAISRVPPKYTEEARQARIQGIVILEAVIDPRGEVKSVRVLKGLPLGLDGAAVEAVKRWKFEPARLQGQPVAVYFILTVNFKLE